MLAFFFWILRGEDRGKKTNIVASSLSRGFELIVGRHEGGGRVESISRSRATSYFCFLPRLYTAMISVYLVYCVTCFIIVDDVIL